MYEFLHLILSAYAVLLFLDILRSYYNYDEHKFVTFDKPIKKWRNFFIDEHKWTIGTLIVTLLLGLMFI